MNAVFSYETNCYSYTFCFCPFLSFLLLCGLLKFGNCFSRGHCLCAPPHKVFMTDEKEPKIFVIFFFTFSTLSLITSRKIASVV